MPPTLCLLRKQESTHGFSLADGQRRRHTVRADQDFALFLAYEPQNGASPFCCDGPYDNTTGTCAKPSQGSSQPFELPPGRVVYNRTDGAIMTDGTLSSNYSQRATCDETQTAISQNQTSTPASCPQEGVQVSESGSSNVTAVASGIAVPLGVLLLASLLAVVVLLRQNRALKKSLRQGLPAERLPALQMIASHEGTEGGKSRGQEVYGYTALSEMSDSRAPIESGGRSAAQELPARYHG